jgi:hypothetical protein
MDPQLYPHHQREFFIHPERQNPNDLGTCRRESANEQDDLKLKPASVFLKNGSIIQWPRIWRPFRKWL